MNCPVCRDFLVFAAGSTYHYCMCERLKCMIDDSESDLVYIWKFRFSMYDELELDSRTDVLSVFTLRTQPTVMARRNPIPEDSRVAVVEHIFLMAELENFMMS